MDSTPFLDLLLETFQVTLVYLPTYSPELNPCELVFSKLKGFLRRYRNGERLKEIVLAGLSQVSRKNVHFFYKHCLFPEVILPDFIFLDDTRWCLFLYFLLSLFYEMMSGFH